MKRMALLLLVVALTGLISCGLFGDNPARQTLTEYFSPAGDYYRIEVDNEVGTVIVNTGDVTEITVEYERVCTGTSARDAKNHLNDIYVYISGNQETGIITVEGEVPDDNLDLRNYEVNFTITAPRDIQLDIAQATGDVEVDDLTYPPTINVTTGNITATGLDCEIDAMVTTGDIDCTIDNLPSEAPIELDVITGTITLVITAMDVTAVSDIDLTGVTTDVYMTFPANSELEFDLETTTGGVQIDQDFDYTPREEGAWSNLHKQGTIGSSDTRSTLDATVVTGTITLDMGS